MINEDDEIIDPEKLDPETLRAVQRLINGYPLLQTGEPHHSLNDYRQGRKDAFTAVVPEWLDGLRAPTMGDVTSRFTPRFASVVT